MFDDTEYKKMSRASLLDCGLPVTTWLDFCTADECHMMRQTCRQMRKMISRTWTYDVVLVTDSPQRHGMASVSFFDDIQLSCRFTDQLICVHIQLSKLRLSPILRRLDYLTIFHAYALTRVTIPKELRRLHYVLIVNVPNLEFLEIAPECTRLGELTLAQLRLRAFSLRPEWAALRMISLREIGFFPELTIPATYTQLQHVHLANMGLQRLYIQIDLSKRRDAFERLTLRLHEMNSVGRVQIVTTVENEKGMEIYSNVATEFVAEQPV